jgi:putative ABC transport system permease protein
MIMSVLERTWEIGTSMALGVRRRDIVALFLAEGCVLGLVGAVAGLVIGVALALLLSAIGIPMPPPPGMRHGFTGGVLMTAPVLASAFAIAIATALVASIYPAHKASRLPIVDALRHNR